MSQTHTRVVFPLFFSFISVFTVAEAEMIFQSAERTIHGSGTQLEAEEMVTTNFAPLADDLLNSGYIRDGNNTIVGSVSAFASQSSSISETQVRGLARGSGFASGPGEGIGLSSMAIDFDINQETRFTLTGQLRLAPHDQEDGIAESIAYIRLTGPSGIAMEVELDEANPPNSLGIVDFTKDNRITGIYPEGSYRLEAYAKGHGSDGKTRCVDFDFTLTALNAISVPEAATPWYSALVLSGLWGLRRRRPT